MRSIIELQDYLKETFEDDVHECLMCMEIVTIGERCSQERCNVRLHLHCAAGYFPEEENGTDTNLVFPTHLDEVTATAKQLMTVRTNNR
jgi:hypothetical protein